MAGSGTDIRAGRAFVELMLKNSLTRGLTKARDQLKQFGQSTMAMGKSLVTVAAGAAVPIAFATKTFMDFDDAMRMVKAVSQSTDAEFQQLTNTAKKLGASTSFTATQVANLMGELGKAGFSAAEVDKMTESVLALSRASGTDATLSAGIMATTLKQFELGAADAARVADTLTHTANATFNSVEAMGEALSYCGTEAKAANMPLEDTFAILGMLGDVGIQGSSAGTVVRRLLVMSGAEAEKMNRIFGVAFKDAAGNARPLVDVLGEVHEATKDMGTAERAAKFNEAFGLLGITGAGVIGKNVGRIKELRDELLASQGVAQKTAKEMDGGLGGAFRRMMSAIEGVQIAIGDALAGTLEDVAAKVEKISGAIIKFVGNNKKLVLTIAAVVAGIGLAGVALIAIGAAASGVSAIIGALITVISGIGAVLGFVLSPLGLIVAALVAGVAAWAAWTESGQAAVGGVKDLFGSLLGTFQETWGGIVKAIMAGDFEAAGKVAWAGMMVVWEQAKTKLFKFWLDVKWHVLSVWNDVVSGIASAWVNTVAYLKTTWNSFKTGVANGWDAIMQQVSEKGIDMSAQVGAITDEEAADVKQRITDALAERQGKRTLDAEAEERQIEEERKGTLSALDQDRQREFEDLNRKYDADLAAREKQLADARAELRAITGGIGDGSEEAAAGADDPAAMSIKSMRENPAFADKLNKLSSTGPQFGSFSAAALGAVGAGGIQQKQLAEQRKAREEAKRIAEEQKRRDEQLRQAVKNNRLQVVA